MLCIGFPTSIFDSFRVKYNDIPETKNRIDNASFWLFFFGIFRPSKESYFYVTYGMLIIGLVFERSAITWLTNRFGCTYFRLQKFIELDMRREAIRAKNCWEFPNPEYNIERYRKHYFYTDFDILKRKFESISDGSPKFIPYKEAIRIRDTIKFSIMLDCGAPEIGSDPKTK
jgi:hypothetical protein